MNNDTNTAPKKPEPAGKVKRQRTIAPLPPQRLYDERQAACYLGRTLWGMRELRYAGKIAFVNGGRRKFYDVQDLDRYIEENKTKNRY